MKVPMILFAACSVLGCSGGEKSTGSTLVKGQVVYTLDAQSCTGKNVSTLNFFIDGFQVGSENLSPGTHSQVFEVYEGFHLVAASEAKVGGRQWNPVTALVTKSVGYNQVLLC